MINQSRVHFAIRHLHLRHFRAFEETVIPLHPELNVIIGINGAGKTSVLECLARLLQVYVHLLGQRSITGIHWGEQFKVNDLMNGKENGSVTLEAEVKFTAKEHEAHEEGDLGVEEGEMTYHRTVRWEVALSRAGGGWLDDELSNDWSALEELALELRQRFNEPKSGNVKHEPALPIVAFFPSNIALGPLEYGPEKEVFKQTSPFYSLSDALTPAALDYHSFFRWFRWLQSKQRSEREEQLFDQVKQAVSGILNGAGKTAVYDNLHIDWEQSVSGELAINKNGRPLKMSQFSEGEKRLVLMAAQLAYRLSIANPKSAAPLKEGSGVVLIDEIDLHLHPQWESRVVPSFRQVFPSLQFIITSHSAAVLQSVGREHLLVLDNGQVLDSSENPFTLGRQIDEISQDAFGLAVYPEHTPALKELQAKIRQCHDFIDSDQLEKAEALLAEIEALRGPNDSDVDLLKNMLELARI